MATLSTDNIGKLAPRWFRRTKRAVTVLSDTAIIMLLAMGYKDDSFVMLCLRVGVSGVLNSIEMLLADETEIKS